MPGPGEGPCREPQSYGRVDGASEPNEARSKSQAGGGGNDAGLENDAEPAGDNDGRRERGNEDTDDIGAVTRRFLGDFGIHAEYYDIDFWVDDKSGKLEVANVKMHKVPVQEDGIWTQVPRYTFEGMDFEVTN